MSSELSSFRDGLLKKDDTARVVEETAYSVVIESDQQLIDEIDNAVGEDFEDPTIFQQEMTGLPLTPAVRVARTVFIVHTGFSFLVVFFGVIPYYFFRADVPLKGLEWMLVTSILLCVGAYVALTMLTDPFNIIPVMGVWMFLVFVSVTTLAALMKNLVPFQAAAVHFCQGLSMLVYCFVSHRELNPILSVAIMFGWGCVAWLLGLYAFLHYNDWILSFLLFLICVIGSSVYSGYQISLLNRFNVSRKDQVNAVKHFYLDLILLPLSWIVHKILSIRANRALRELSETLKPEEGS